MLNWFKRRRDDVTSNETNEEWVQALSHPADEMTVKQLRQKLIRGLKRALHKYADRELDQFVEDVAQGALLKSCIISTPSAERASSPPGP